MPADRCEHDPALVRWVLDTLLPAEGALLDLGCGDGRITAALSETGAEAVGADPSVVALERAREAAPAARFVVVDADNKLPLPDSAFAGAVAVNVLEHVADTQTLMSELRRVLAPGARVAITVPANSWLRTALTGPGAFERAHDPLEPVLRFYTKRTLAGLLEQSGFEQVAIERSGRLLLASAARG